MTCCPDSPHSSSFLRVLILAEMLRHVGVGGEARQLVLIWRGLYDPNCDYRTLPALRAGAGRATL